MNMKKYFNILFVVAILGISCNETLDETYEDWVGDGKIRYVAKCSDIIVTPGWERLFVTWKNGMDATIEHVKVKWSATGVQDSVLLQATDTSYNICNLTDGSYRIELVSIASDGAESLTSANYGRPYTESHEVVRTFTQGIVKSYILKEENTLVYWADIYDETNVFEMKVHYMGIDGMLHEASVWKEEPEGWLDMEYYEQFEKQTLHVITDVNLEEDSSIYITRLGILENCPDTIPFEPIVVSRDRNFTSDFKSVIERRYGFSDQTEIGLKEFNMFIDTVSVLEFDYDITSFEDVLYCPNLKKIVLGKNRYQNVNYPMNSVLYDEERSLDVLEQANKLKGVTIERYGNHYFFENIPAYLEEKGLPSLPANLECISLIEYIDTVVCSVPEIVGHDSHLNDFLFDNDPETCWNPLGQPDARTYEITVSLKEALNINGFKIQQPNIVNSQIYFPNQILIQVSKDQVSWENATYVLENVVGQGVGEITLLPLMEPGEYKYFRFTVTDQVYINLACIMIADLVPYRLK